MKQILIPMLLLVLSSCLSSASAETLFVVGHKGSFNVSRDSQRVAEYYLLKLKVSSEGDPVIPINLPSKHVLRHEFSLAVFNRSPISLGEYWDRMSFRGIKPPVVQNSEQAVLLFVGRIKGAIGYVSQKPALDSQVVVLSEIHL